jgi:hypothetical protein
MAEGRGEVHELIRGMLLIGARAASAVEEAEGDRYSRRARDKFSHFFYTGAVLLASSVFDILRCR